MQDDPWRDIHVPDVSASINARRVDAEAPRDFFWARDLDGKCLLALGHNVESMPDQKLPVFKGVEVFSTRETHDDYCLLCLRLLDDEHRDIFHHLCLDIMHGAAYAESEKQAISITLARTWRWHHLLRGGGRGRLSAEEQKGLIGELHVLEHILLPYLDASDAVEAWLGPSGAPKDFEVGRIAVESKARRGSATPYVKISSAEQLDDHGCDALFLHVLELAQVPVIDNEGLTLPEYIDRVQDLILDSDPGVLALYEGRVSAAGYQHTDDYSDMKWLEGPSYVFSVKSGFPRLISANVPLGVEAISYSVSLMDCESFIVDESELTEALSGVNNGD